MKFCIIDGCPVPASIAPYIYLVLRDARQNANSIYRGQDAVALLHRLGKHTQAEIHMMYPSISNPAGRSQHELRSDGIANRGPAGRHLEEWQVGVDSGSDAEASKDAITRSADKFGWHVRHPYSRGVEAHHWCFSSPPRARGVKQRVQIINLRRKLRA